jgi:hypothetical protein
LPSLLYVIDVSREFGGRTRTRTLDPLIKSQKFFLRSVVTAASFVNPRFGKFARMVSAT